MAQAGAHSVQRAGRKETAGTEAGDASWLTTLAPDVGTCCARAGASRQGRRCKSMTQTSGASSMKSRRLRQITVVASVLAVVVCAAGAWLFWPERTTAAPTIESLAASVER